LSIKWSRPLLPDGRSCPSGTGTSLCCLPVAPACTVNVCWGQCILSALYMCTRSRWWRSGLVLRRVDVGLPQRRRLLLCHAISARRRSLLACGALTHGAVLHARVEHDHGRLPAEQPGRRDAAAAGTRWWRCAAPVPWNSKGSEQLWCAECLQFGERFVPCVQRARCVDRMCPRPPPAALAGVRARDRPGATSPRQVPAQTPPLWQGTPTERPDSVSDCVLAVLRMATIECNGSVDATKRIAALQLS
jgi:hypothetical protein